MQRQATRKDNSAYTVEDELSFHRIKPLQSLSNFSICFSYVTTLEITYGFTIEIQLLTLAVFEIEHNH